MLRDTTHEAPAAHDDEGFDEGYAPTARAIYLRDLAAKRAAAKADSKLMVYGPTKPAGIEKHPGKLARNLVIVLELTVGDGRRVWPTAEDVARLDRVGFTAQTRARLGS